jgi:hypothetical protein
MKKKDGQKQFGKQVSFVDESKMSLGANREPKTTMFT